MKQIIITLLFFTALMVVWQVAESNYTYERVANTLTATVPDQYADTDAIAVGDIDEMYCIGVGELSGMKVEVQIENLEGTVAGQFIATQRLIQLDEERGRDVGTIAHEVSHLVDHLLVLYPTDNEHMRAYYQGNWTQCVYTHMVEWTHHKKAKNLINQMYGY